MGRGPRGRPAVSGTILQAEVGAGAAPEAARKDLPAAGVPAPDRFALPALRHGSPQPDPVGRRRLEGPDRGQPRRDQGLDRRGRRPDPDAQGLPEARPLRGRDVDGPRVLQAPRIALSRPRLRHPEGRPPRARDVVDQVRARRRPHDRPDEPLQHDVQPVLHGRQPGRLRPRARMGRGSEAPRRRGLDQAAPPALGPVLRRRAHALAALPGGHPVRAQDRLLLGPVRDQRDPLRAGRELREAGGRGGAALRVPPVRRRRQRAQPAPQGRQPLRRQAPRDREPPQARRRRDARRDDRQRDQQRPGRRHRPLRSREHRQGHLRGVPAGVVHRPRRGHRRRDAEEAALHALAPRARREDAGRHRRADARLVPAIGGGPVLGPEGPARRPRVRVGLVQVRLSSQLRHRHADARRRADEEGRAPFRRSSTSTGSSRTSRSSRTRAARRSGPRCKWDCPSSATCAPRACRRA